MNVSVEHLGPCKKLLRFELDASEVSAEFDSLTKDYLKQAALPGFRPGKAPKHMILKSFGPRIEEEVKRKMTSDAYKKAIEEHKFRPITYPDVEEGEFGLSSGLKFTATVEVQPDFELPDYKGLAVKRENRVVTDEDVEKALNLLRDQRATYTDAARAAQTGDFAVVNYTGTCEGKPIVELVPTARGLSEQKEFWVEIGSPKFLPGFSEQLLGASAGDKRTVTVTFPADFVAVELGGKTGVFEVEVVQIKERVLPPVDEELAKAYGALGVDALRQGVRVDLEKDLKARLKRSVRDQLVAALLNRVDFDLPDILVQQETRTAVYDIVRANQERGVPKEAIDGKKDEIYSVASDSAKDRVKAMLLLSRIAEKEGLQVTREEVGNHVLALAARHQIKPDKLVKQLQENNGIAQIQEQILHGKTLDLLELNAQVEDVVPSAG